MADKKPLGLGVFLFGAFFLLLPTSVIVVWNWSTLSRIGLKLLELTYADAPGEVLSSEVESRVDGDGDKVHWVKIAYRYTANEHTYTGTRVESRPMPSSGPWARRYVETHPPGAPVRVRFDPSDPAISVLETGFTKADPFFVLALLPVNVYLGLGWLYFWKWCFIDASGPVFDVTGTGYKKQVRLPQGTTWAIPLAVAVFGLPVSYLLFFVVAGSRSSIWMGAPVLLAVLALAARLYQKRVSALRTGKFDLVIDPQSRSLTLPCTFGRRESLAVPFSAVRSVKVETRTIETDDSVSFTYRPTVAWTGTDGQGQTSVVAEWDDQACAELLAAWIQQQLNVRVGREGRRKAG